MFELVGKNVKPGKPKPMGRMSFSRLPNFNQLIVLMASYIPTLPADKLLVCKLGVTKTNVNNSAFVYKLMKDVCSSSTVLSSSAHCIRVGTCVTLHTLGFDKNRLDIHCNWSDDSNSYRTYVRQGCQVESFDKLFFYDALPVFL